MARSLTEDYYAILEVSQFATVETIRESYKKLALKLHPDRNKDERATSDFQKLLSAWETLRDWTKRAEYDRTYVRVAKRKSGGGAGNWKRRREDVGRNAMDQWTWSGEEQSPGEAIRLERARVWKATAKKDYSSRFQTWEDFRKQHLIMARECQESIRNFKNQLKEQMVESEEHMSQRFREALELSNCSGDYATLFSKLLEAKRNYVSKVFQAIENSRNRFDQLLDEVQNERRRYEEEEAKARQIHIREALEILGPRDLRAPIFSVIGRRGQAINYWKALSRVKNGVKFPFSLEGSEGPWHQAGKWERIGGEHTCGRCDQFTFHIIAECGPAKCPGCGIVLCNGCHRDLQLLREYENYIVSEGDSKHSLFSMEFSSTDEPLGSRKVSGFDEATDNTDGFYSKSDGYPYCEMR